MRTPTIYYFCPEIQIPLGSVRVLYRHVDLLNQNGFNASIIHSSKGFRCTWFKNTTRVAAAIETVFHQEDFLVFPETWVHLIGQSIKGMRKVIFNQSAYMTFTGYPFDGSAIEIPYEDDDIMAALVVSEDSKEYLQYVFPKLNIQRIRMGIDTDLFSYEPQKKRQICFMPRKGVSEIQQVLSILKCHHMLKDFSIVSIHNKTLEEVAAIMKESLVFLSVCQNEGFFLPAAEAMACGCIVIGYDGRGGKEYFKPEFSYPIPHGDIITFAQAAEDIISIQNNNPEFLTSLGEQAARFIQQTYSLKQEEQDVVQFWTAMVANVVGAAEQMSTVQ